MPEQIPDPHPAPVGAPSLEEAVMAAPHPSSDVTGAVPGAAPDPRAPRGEREPSVFPLRFTSDAPAMIAFLRLLGMAPAVTGGKESYGELVAGAGRVMIHSVSGAESGARAVDTDLCFSVPDTDAAAAELRTRGFAVDVWDETYGRQGVITLPTGESVGLNEHQRDLYGYRGHDASAADPRLTVTAVLSSADFAADADWAARLGFVAEDRGTEGYRALHGGDGAGVIGLHSPLPDGRRARSTGTEFGDSLQVHLGFETSEDLEELAERLRAAGHPAEVGEEGGVRAVRVTDPDGEPLEIHPRPVP